MRAYILVGALACLTSAASASEIAGGYGGLFVADGTSTELANSYGRLTQPSLGGFVGFNFVHGDYFWGPEVYIRANTRNETTLKYTDVDMSFPTASGTYRLKMREDLSSVASLRIGRTLGPVAFYGRMGVGFSLISEEEDNEGFYLPNDATTHTTSSVFSAAAGAEYTFKRAFVRLEGEFRAVPDPHYYENKQFQINAGIGLRF